LLFISYYEIDSNFNVFRVGVTARRGYATGLRNY